MVLAVSGLAPAMKNTLAIRHVAFEDLGSFEGVLRQRGHGIAFAEAGGGLGGVDALAPDLMVVLGGPIGACQDRDYPFLAQEVALIARRLEAGRPILGICLGAQLMARALGARVYAGPAKEIGWSPLTLTAQGRRSVLRHLDPSLTPVLHWHGDTFDLPAAAVLLASTPHCAHQAFSWGGSALALQFHPEATAAGLENWYIGHIAEIAATPGIDVLGLRAAAAKWAPGLEVQGPKFFSEWLDLEGV
jgi:GMP synthase (glutamine-hydrolysing)